METLVFMQAHVPSGSLTTKGKQIFALLEETRGEKPVGCMIVVDQNKYPDIQPGDSLRWHASVMTMSMPNKNRELITFENKSYRLYYLNLIVPNALVKNPNSPSKQATNPVPKTGVI